MLGRCCGKIVLALHVKDATHVTVTVTVRRVTVTVTKSVGWDCVTVRRVTGHVAKSCLAYCVLALHKQLVASDGYQERSTQEGSSSVPSRGV